MEYDNFEELLYDMESEYESSPYRVWNDLVKGDLLLVKVGKSYYIIEVDKFNTELKVINTTFIFSFNSNKIYRRKGFEHTKNVERSPTNKQLMVLKKKLWS